MRRLFEPNSRAIGRPPEPTKCDAAPDSLIDGTPSELRDDGLARLLGKKQVYHRAAVARAVVSNEFVDSVAWCHDLLPRLNIARKLTRVAVHRTRSMNHLGISAHQRQEGRARRQTCGRVHFSKQNLRNGPFARNGTTLPIVCLPARGTNSPETVIGPGRGLTDADL